MPICSAGVVRRCRSTSGKSRPKRYPATRISPVPPRELTISASVIIPHFRRASWPSQPGQKSTAMPRSDGSAASAAPRVRITRLPRDPEGARSLGTSTYVSTPSNGTRLGWSRTSGIVTAIASSFIRSPRSPDSPLHLAAQPPIRAAPVPQSPTAPPLSTAPSGSATPSPHRVIRAP